MKITAFLSTKGGVGKTSDAVLFAVALARKYPGRVLLVDLDPNNNATDAGLRLDLAASEQEADALFDDVLNRNIYHVLAHGMPIEDALFQSTLDPGLTILPAVPRLGRIGREIGDNPAIYPKFKNWLKRVDCDWVVVDSPPALVMELRLALYVADFVMVPVSGNRWVLSGYDLVHEELQELAELRPEPPKVLAVPSLVTTAEAEMIRTTETLKDEFRLSRGLPPIRFTETSVFKMAAIKNVGTTAVAPKDGTAAAGIFQALVREIE